MTEDTKENSKQSAIARAAAATTAIRSATTLEAFRDGFRVLNFVVWIMTVAIVGLSLANVYVFWTYHPTDTFYAENVSGKQVQLVGLYKPNINRDTLLAWGTMAATSAMTFGFNDYEKRLGTMRGSFTKKGWESFHEAVILSGVIKTAVEEQQIITAVPRGPATMFSEGVTAGQYNWIVEVPLLLTVRSGANKRSDLQTIRIIIVPAPTREMPAGIAIDRWISF